MNLDIAPNSTFRYSGNISHFQADGMAQKAFIRADFHFPASTQEKMVRAAGATNIYDDFDDLLHSLRRHELVMVADLRALGSSIKEIAASMALIREAGAAIIQAGTGLVAADAGVELAWEASRLLANDRRGGQVTASKIGRKGHAAALKAKRKQQRPIAQCEAIWHDRSHRTTADAVDAVNEGFAPRSKTSLYNKFGPRGVVAGRRS